MKKFFKSLIPPPKWRVPVIIVLGALTGVALYALIESKAWSYMSDDPKACTNCHVMTPEYVTWSNSSHRERAVCNDCHVPHESVFKKYAFKAKDGLYHSYVFTSHTEPQVIRMKEAGQEVVQSNCIRCHEKTVATGSLSAKVSDLAVHNTDRKCWTCHREVPHGRVHSLSAVKYYGKFTDKDQQTIPDWMFAADSTSKEKSSPSK